MNYFLAEKQDLKSIAASLQFNFKFDIISNYEL